MTSTSDPSVMNVAAAVSVAWRPREDGATLTYLERADGADAIYEYRTDVDASERLVDFDERVSGRFGPLDWDPSGERVAYTRDGDVRFYDATTGEEHSPAPSDAFDGPPRWGPDGDRLAFVSGRGEAGNDVWIADADGSAVEQVTEGAAPHDDKRWRPTWSPDGDAVAYVRATEVNGHDWGDEAHVTYLSSGRDVRLTRGLTLTSVPTWSPNGDRLAFFATRVAEPWYRQSEDLHVVDPDTGSSEVHAVEASHQYFQQAPVWSPDGRKIYFPVRDRGEQHVEAILLHDESDAYGVTTRVTTHDGVFGAGPVELSPDGSTLGFSYAAFDRPAHPRTLPTGGGSPDVVRDPDVPDGVTIPENVTYESFDGAYVNAYVYRPADATAEDPVPALVQVHGGAHFQYGDGWHPLEQYLAAHGFVVVAVDYRGSGGFGRAFQELSMGDWEGGEVRDIREAARFARGLSYTTDQVGIYGQSWGGFMTMHELVQFPEVFDAAVEWYGVVNQRLDYEEADRIGRLLRERDIGGTIDEFPEAYHSAGTHYRLDEVQTPLAILHGAEDERVPVGQAYEIRDALEESGVDYDLTIYDSEGHGFRDGDNREDAAVTTREWFERYLK